MLANSHDFLNLLPSDSTHVIVSPYNSQTKLSRVSFETRIAFDCSILLEPGSPSSSPSLSIRRFLIANTFP